MSNLSRLEEDAILVDATKQYVDNLHNETLLAISSFSDDISDLKTNKADLSTVESLTTQVNGKASASDVNSLTLSINDIINELGNLSDEVDTLNEGGLQIKDSLIESTIDTWLDNNPDATTTVQDGSLTVAKFSSSTLKDIAGVNAKVFGAKGDGVTNDSVILQSLIDQLYTDGGGELYLPKGTYVLNTELKWKPNVSIVGDGVGATILKPVYSGTTGGLNLSAIGFNADEFGHSKETAFTNCLFKDFEIDGSGVVSTDSMYSVSIKGIYMQYLINCRFENLYIHDTIATGLGVDYLEKTVIDGVMVKNCGRGYGVYGGGSLGGAGIGIGSGYLESENSIVTNCIADGCGSNGIFYEHQKLFNANGQEYDAKGIIITNCICKNNRYNGIGLRGGDTVIISDCIIYDNKTGIHLNTLSASNVRIVNCDSRDNTDADLLCTIDIDGLTVLDSLFGTVAFTNVYEENVLQNVTISNNRFLDGCKIRFPKCINFVFSGNTMMDSPENHLYIGGAGDITNENIRIVNNVFGESNSGGQYNVANGANIRLHKAVSVGIIANNMFKPHTASPTTYYVSVGHSNTQTTNVHLYGNRAFGSAITAQFTNCANCSLDGTAKP